MVKVRFLHVVSSTVPRLSIHQEVYACACHVIEFVFHCTSYVIFYFSSILSLHTELWFLPNYKSYSSFKNRYKIWPKSMTIHSHYHAEGQLQNHKEIFIWDCRVHTTIKLLEKACQACYGNEEVFRNWVHLALRNSIAPAKLQRQSPKIITKYTSQMAMMNMPNLPSISSKIDCG